MRLPKRLQNFSGAQAGPRRAKPINLYYFPMHVPKSGYRWVEEATPADPVALFWRVNKDLGGAPFLVMNGSFERADFIPVRTYYPLVNNRDLFLTFKSLSLDRESILAFANDYGWIGDTGVIDCEERPWVDAVGITVWQSEIQMMMLACHLWDAVRNDDRKELRRYLKWGRGRLNVRFGYRIQGREILPAAPIRGPIPAWARDPKRRGEPDPPIATEGERPIRVPESQGESTWLIREEEVPEFERLRWSSGEIRRAGRLAIRHIVNPRLARLCAPRLYLNADGDLVSHITPKNLLGCLWLQFHLAVTGQREIRFCKVCNGVLDLAGHRRGSHDEHGDTGHDVLEMP